MCSRGGGQGMKEHLQRRIWSRIEKKIRDHQYTTCDDVIVVGKLILSPDGIGFLITGRSHVYQPEHITKLIKKEKI